MRPITPLTILLLPATTWSKYLLKPRNHPVPFLLTSSQPIEDDIPDLKDCSTEAPCQYSEGDCTRHGDDGCDSDLVCGVNNCGDFEPGMAGSCCAQLAGPSTFREEKVPRQWTSWSATWGGWGRYRARALIASNGTLYYQYEKQSLE